MSNFSFVRVGTLAIALTTLSAGAFPAPIQSASDSQPSVQKVNQAAEGKISAVSNDGFSLDVKAGDASSTIQFVTTADTKFTGTPQVGAVATVQYKNDADGRNIATAVVVQTNT